MRCSILFFFFFNDTATTEIYTLSLHDALPILRPGQPRHALPEHERLRGQVRRRARARPDPGRGRDPAHDPGDPRALHRDRKSTRLNSSHANISYAVFCLKKKKKTKTHLTNQIN